MGPSRALVGRNPCVLEGQRHFLIKRWIGRVACSGRRDGTATPLDPHCPPLGRDLGYEVFPGCLVRASTPRRHAWFSVVVLRLEPCFPTLVQTLCDGAPGDARQPPRTRPGTRCRNRGQRTPPGPHDDSASE